MCSSPISLSIKSVIPRFHTPQIIEAMEAYSHITIPLLVFLLSAFAVSSTRVGFYKTTCPQAEAIVQSVVQSAIRSNKSYASGLLQMFFHGCDASILIDGSFSEKTAATNLRLRGFDVIDAAKSMLETVCPGVVSCADILALATRDSVVQIGGPGWAVPTGRRDGLVSLKSEAESNIPGPKASMDDQIKVFASKGLNVKDLVILVGGHTTGTAACSTFIHRLYSYNNTNGPDPDIDQSFLPHLGGEGATRVALDTNSVNTFDTSFFENIRSGRGVLETDSMLWTDARTQKYAQRFTKARRSHQSTLFNKMFARAMVKMSKIELKTGNQGEIRRVCNTINTN
ncbi:peroxidase N1-like [Bidens hawaiensis]|uniref:peroxidase N1-like n=1 Tax=Bidens hawaiensis TaxID=980011 RepID=UPI0040493C21